MERLQFTEGCRNWKEQDPFPAVVYNHGCGSGTLSKEAFYALGPEFSHGRLFFGPTAEVKV
jgi:hypothetical protein